MKEFAGEIIDGLEAAGYHAHAAAEALADGRMLFAAVKPNGLHWVSTEGAAGPENAAGLLDSVLTLVADAGAGLDVKMGPGEIWVRIRRAERDLPESMAADRSARGRAWLHDVAAVDLIEHVIRDLGTDDEVMAMHARSIIAAAIGHARSDLLVEQLGGHLSYPAAIVLEWAEEHAARGETA